MGQAVNVWHVDGNVVIQITDGGNSTEAHFQPASALLLGVDIVVAARDLMGTITVQETTETDADGAFDA